MENNNEHKLHAQGDTLLLALIAAGLPLSIAIGFQFDRIPHALWFGSAFVLAAVVLWLFARGTLLTRLAMGALAMSMVALQVHVGMGDSVYHFGFFVTLAI